MPREIRPSSFVVAGSIVKSRFVNEDTGDGYRNYEGNVEKIVNYGKDDNGTYVSCSITYEDGERVADAHLYDKDFENEESEDCWSMLTRDSMLIKWMHDLSNDAKGIKQAVAALQEPDSSDECSDSAYSSSIESSVCEVPTGHQGSVILDMSRVVFNVVASGFLLAYTYKLAVDCRLV